MEQVLARKPRSNNKLLLEKEEPKANVTEQETSKSAIVLNNKSSDQLQKSQIWSELSDANLVVATIIATVTFSAAFQVPGGYQSDGMAVLRKEKYFRLYLISDALSFGFAAASMFVTFFTGLFGANSGFSYPRRWVTFLTGISVWFMVFAFMLGTSAVMAEDSGFAGLARSVACVSFIWPVVFLGAVAVNWFTYFPWFPLNITFVWFKVIMWSTFGNCYHGFVPTSIIWYYSVSLWEIIQIYHNQPHIQFPIELGYVRDWFLYSLIIHFWYF